MIKYLGSKRRLVPVLGEMFTASRARTALDLFTGTTRVAQELKRRGAHVTAVDSARYAEVFARCYISTDATEVDKDDLADALRALDILAGKAGYMTETFCKRSRFFQPHNGERIDAIRDAIERDFAGSSLESVLLTSLVEAADRVDSTTGLQMAYVKKWASRSFGRLTLRSPELLVGPGTAVRGNAVELVGGLGEFDIAYLDPPYNQHRYYSNYHVWETLIAWDAPEAYGVACKRIDCRDDSTRSAFNRRREMPAALERVLADVRARLVVLSYNDESWVGLDRLREMCGAGGRHVEVLGFDSKRYVGARIGIHNPRGEKVGQVGRLRNVEYLLVAGEREEARRVGVAARVAAAAAGLSPA